MTKPLSACREYRVEVFRGADAKWYWHFKCGANGKILCSSQGYFNRGDAVRASETVTGGLVECRILDAGVPRD